MWHPFDDPHHPDHEQADLASPGQTRKIPTRTVISIVLTPDVETNADVIACTVEAIKALPYVADVTTRKVRARSQPAQVGQGR